MTDNPTPSDSAPQPVVPQATVHNVSASQTATHTVSASGPRVRASQNAVARLHAELDGIISRPVSDAACRKAMLDCLVRCRGLTGGLWFQIDSQNTIADLASLQTELLKRKDIRRWLANTATVAAKEQADVVANCPQVRGLQAICVPVSSDRRGTTRPGTQEAASEFGGLVLVGLVSNGEQATGGQANGSGANGSGTNGSGANGSGANEEVELLAAQCVVRAYRDWSATVQAKRASKQLLATSALLELTNEIGSCDKTITACQTLASALHQHFDAKFAAVALNATLNSTARLICVSGIGEFDPKSQQAGRLEAACNESIVRGEVTEFPAASSVDRHQHLAHKRVAETTGVEAVVSVPLVNRDEETIGAVTLGGSARRMLDPDTKLILTAASTPIGSALTVARQMEGGVVRRMVRLGKEFVTRKRGKLMLAAAAVGIALMFVPMTYRINCRCRAEPVSRRFSLAPYDGLIENTFAQPGDRVQKGDLMARMEGHEIGWELAGLTADTQRANKQRDVHMADLEIADSLISEMEMEKLGAREKLMRHRLANLELRSPVDGIVLSGSLDRRENYPVKIGEVLYEIAPLDPIRLEVAIPADELMHVQPGMQVQVRIDGEDDGQIDGTVTRIQPRSETRDEQNVFIAEVIVANPDGNLKPGMEGAAKISSHKHAIGWNFGHHAWERLMTRIWW